jgi:putative pyruvate formate lyase activating enzyme
LAGEHGSCHAGSETRVFSAQTEVADELVLIPTFAIALSGCDLRCDFCITGAQSWNSKAGEVLNPNQVAAEARKSLARGAKSIMVLGGEPTIHLPAVLELVSALPDTAILIWKTNAHGSEQSRELLDGIFNIWLADFKFGNDSCAERLSRTSRYCEVVMQNLLWADTHSSLIVRHLLMPGHLECCWVPIATWLQKSLPGVQVNLRAGFWPAWQASRHAELRRSVSTEENRRALEIANECELKLIS